VEGQDWLKISRSLGIRWWGDRLKVGVAAVNTATAPLVAEFKDLRVQAPAAEPE